MGVLCLFMNRKFAASALAVLGALAALLVAAPASQAGSRVDPSFGKHGISTVFGDPSVTNELNTPAAIAETRQGKLVVLGNDIGAYRSEQMVLFRLNRNGRLDGTFGDEGYVSSADFPIEKAHPRTVRAGFGRDLAIMGNGRILTTGLHDPDFSLGFCAFLSQLFPDGALRLGFGYQAIKRHCINRTRTYRGKKYRQRISLDSRSIDLTGNGKILLGGNQMRGGGHEIPFLARLNRDGSLDRTFKGNARTATGQKGIVQVRGTGSAAHNRFYEVKALRHRRILAVGGLDGNMVVARFNSDGTLDNRFGDHGLARIDINGKADCYCVNATGVAFDSRGRIVIVRGDGRENGIRNESLLVARLTKNGHLDRSFGRKGIFRARPDWQFEGNAVAIDRKGRIVVAGQHESSFTLVRLKPNGGFDRSFFGRGVFESTDDHLGNNATDLTIDRQGRIVATGGRSGYGMSVIRILP